MAELVQVNLEGSKVDNIEIEYKEILEGKARIFLPKTNTVFYNNVQVFNRDLSVAVIKKFNNIFRSEVNSKRKVKQDAKNKKGDIKKNICNPIDHMENDWSINILEALSATGLRAVRYALEIPGVKIIANDLSKEAVNNITRNINLNKVEAIVSSSLSDASLLMYQHRFPLLKRFQVIDLDPYGSPCQFLDGAVQAIADGGLLCITCTDMGGLCGNHGEAAFAKYGSVPLKAKYCHEMALRIVLASIDSHAGRYKRYIKPLISMSADFYIRVFVRVFTSAAEVKRSASKKSYVFHCNGCETFHLQPVGKCVEVANSKKYNPACGPVVGKECEECGRNFKIGGPIWSSPMHDVEFIKELLEDVKKEKKCYSTFDRINGVLTVMQEELVDQPLYLVLDHLCNVLHSTTPSQAQFRSAILHAGYKVSSTHANETGFKTNAPVSVIWDILRCWVKNHPVNAKKIKEHSPAQSLLSKKTNTKANFETLPGAIPKSKQMGLIRFPVNPEADWGPKAKANSKGYTSLSDKRKELQGKRQRNKERNDPKHFQCKKFKRGECERGDDCKFSHDVTDKKVIASETRESKDEEIMET